MLQNIFQQSETRSLRSGNTFTRANIKTVLSGEGPLRSFGPIVWNELLPNEYKCIVCKHLKTL